MKLCDTCKWADDTGQPEGIALCRFLPPRALARSDGAVTSVWPPVRLQVDGCHSHEDGRERIRLVRDLPSVN